MENQSVLGSFRYTPFSGKLQGAGPVGLGGDHGDAHLLRPHLRGGEGRQPRRVHLPARRPLLGHHHHDLCEHSPKVKSQFIGSKISISIMARQSEPIDNSILVNLNL